MNPGPLIHLHRSDTRLHNNLRPSISLTNLALIQISQLRTLRRIPPTLAVHTVLNFSSVVNSTIRMPAMNVALYSNTKPVFDVGWAREEFS
jgi:hypothetical protein